MADAEQAQERVEQEEQEETLKQRLEREHGELIQELRALIPGAQVLLGFLLSPFSRHQRRRSLLRVGNKKPGPGNTVAAPMSPFRSFSFSATAWPKKPTMVA